MFRYKIIVLLFIFACSAFSQDCRSVYSETTITTIEERFSRVHGSRKGEFFGLVLEDFINSELRPLREEFEKEISHLQLKGTDSKLSSESKTLEVYLQKLDKDLTALLSLKNPTWSKKVFSSESSRQQKLEKMVSEYAICRTNMEACVSQLNTNIRELSPKIGQLENVMARLESKQSEFDNLNTYIQSNISTFGRSANISLGVLTRAVDEIKFLLESAEKIINVHAVHLTSALLQIKEPAIIYQKIKEAIAAGIPEGIKDVRNKSDESSAVAAGKAASKTKVILKPEEVVYWIQSNNVYKGTIKGTFPNGSYAVKDSGGTVFEVSQSNVASLKLAPNKESYSDSRYFKSNGKVYRAKVMGFFPDGQVAIKYDVDGSYSYGSTETMSKSK